ncbi:MAG: type II toxin-antitoxin system RelB/DinJ family antitoxin [Symbiobacteriaceae bacterium]|nr:type II toxin-antitoxin system RelB/DinJ family antitoxin [Symbiobacteriaceae bacterium]
MPKSTTVNVRMDPRVKSAVEDIYRGLGISLSDAVNIFLYQSLITGGLPFDFRSPQLSPETENAIKEARDIMTSSPIARPRVEL